MDDDIGIPLAQDTSKVVYGPPTPKKDQPRKRKYIPVDEEQPQYNPPPTPPPVRRMAMISQNAVYGVQNRPLTNPLLRAFTGKSRRRTTRNKRKRRITRKRI